MQSENQVEFEEYVGELVSPLEAFYKQERSLAHELCFVQPYPGGRVDELTWAEVGVQIRSIAAHLISLGLKPGSKVALLSSNCAHWIMADVAIWMAGHVSVPLYPVLSHRTIAQIIEHSEAQAIFIGKLEGFDAMRPGIPEGIHSIGFPLSPKSVKESCVNWDDIVKDVAPLQASPVFPMSDLATLIYTSGTTGAPKGVMHSFYNLGFVGDQAGRRYNVNEKDRKLSYLPLAHAAERASVELNQLYYGYPIYFSDSLATFADDLRRARPTYFFAVPRIWVKLQQRVLEQMPQEKLGALLSNPETASGISIKLKTALGLDALKIGISGAAPLSSTLMAWYRSIGIEILEGYAMSENFSYSHTSKSGSSKIGSVGTPVKYVECKISDQGEVLVRSPANMLGYYKEAELSAEAIDTDGFLHTGDKGEVDEFGRLKITGRIKEIFKTSKGKYVAPAPIEDLLLSNTSLEMVCVTGADLPSPLAIATLTEVAISKLEEDGGKSELVDELDSLLVNTNARLDKHEQLTCLVVSATPWTIDNDLITPTLKVKRAELEAVFQGGFSVWTASRKSIIFVG